MIKSINEFRLTVDSKSVNEGFTRVAVSAFVTPLDPTLEELSDLKTAVSEAVTNCIVHAYKDTYGKIYINGKIYENNTVKITIRDKGCGISDVSQAMTPLFTTGGREIVQVLALRLWKAFVIRLRSNQKMPAAQQLS